MTVGPRAAARGTQGTGDTMFAAIVAAVARGSDLETALRSGVAGGALNAVRRGFGSGSPRDIQRLADSVEIAPIQ